MGLRNLAHSRFAQHIHRVSAQGRQFGERAIQPRGSCAGRPRQRRRQCDAGRTELAAGKPAVDIGFGDGMDCLVARVSAAHVIDDEQAARPRNPQHFTRYPYAYRVIVYRTEQGEGNSEIERVCPFRDVVGAAAVNADLGRMRFAVVDCHRVEVDAGHVFRASTPLHKHPQVVARRAAGFERPQRIERLPARLSEQLRKEAFAFLHHEEVAGIQNRLVGHPVTLEPRVEPRTAVSGSCVRETGPALASTAFAFRLSYDPPWRRDMTIEQTYIERNPESAKLYARASKVLPSGVTHDSRFMRPFPLYAERAAAARKWDADGHELIDYVGGHGALLLGHNHPAVIEAAQAQLANGTHYGASQEKEIEWAEEVIRLVPSDEWVRFPSSGPEATFMAFRLA